VSENHGKIRSVRRRAHRLLVAAIVLAAGILVPLLATSAGARPAVPVVVSGQIS
jgi:hypothetical protein